MNKRIISASLIAVVLIAGVGIRFLRDFSDEILLYRKPTYQLPETLTPVKSLSTADNAVTNLIYEGLFTIDRFLEVRPQLVEKWQLDLTGVTYTFVLKPSIHFHDGTLLKAGHVVEMFQKLMAKDSPVRLRYERIRQVVALDDRTVKVELRNPYPPFISLLAAPAARVSIDREDLPYALGTGPFRVVSLGKGQEHRKLLLERFAGYHGSRPAIQRMEIVEASQKEVFAGVQTGVFDDSVIYPYFAIPEQDLKRSQANRLDGPGTTTWVLALNTGAGPTADRSLRQCLVQAFDRKSFVEQFVPEHRPAKGILPPSLMGSGRITELEKQPRPCGSNRSVPITLIYPEVLERGAEMCAAFSADFAKAGVKITCKGEPFEQLISEITAKRFQIAFLSQTLDLPDVEYFVETFESNAPFNLSNYHSPSLDRALAEARREPDRVKRATYFSDIDNELYRNVATINISYPPNISYWNRCLEGVQLSLAGEPYVDYTAIRAKSGCKKGMDGGRRD